MSVQVPDAEIFVTGPLRGPGSQDAAGWPAQSLTLSTAWGAQPGTATVVYITEHAPDLQIASHGVAVGALCRLTIGTHVFYGLCQSDTPVADSNGKTRVLQFADLREYLTWDFAFGQINIPDTVTVTHPVTGLPVRRRRWKHLLPANWFLGVETYSDTPYSAAQALNFIFNAPTVGLRWGRRYLPEMFLTPVHEIEFTAGKRLDQLLVEISEKIGVTFTLRGFNHRGDPILEWGRKGFLKPGESFPMTAQGGYDFDDASENQRDGFALSGHPHRALVVGDRNLYQILNLNLEPDWRPAWEPFFDRMLFIRHVFENFQTPDGDDYDDLPGDTADHARGWQLARARALELTVRQFAALKDASSPGSGEPFRDYRKFAGRARLDMPCVLYIETLLFRAFRPPAWITVNGISVPSASLKLIDGMLVPVTHDPTTGLMSADPASPLDGNGYAIVRGYNVGQDFFQTIRPDKFRLADWTSAMDLWQAIPFQIDDSGEGTRFILFDQPVIRSDSLFADGSVEDYLAGFALFRADAEILTPPVRASLTFAIERFTWATPGHPSLKDIVVSEPGLRSEFVYDAAVFGAPLELPYADGQTARQKAAVIANAALLRQPVFKQGGFRRMLMAGDAGTALNGMYDRITVQCSPSGVWEEVDFTTERGRSAFEPVRDYERALGQQGLFPGQAELMREARASKLAEAAFKDNPREVKRIGEEFRKYLGEG